MSRLLLVGLDEPEVQSLRERLDEDLSILAYSVLPRIKLEAGELFVERPNAHEVYVPVTSVVFHGIFEDDFPFLTALALWGGFCLPWARGMMDARLRIPCLVRALSVTRFGSMRRGFADRGSPVEPNGSADLVAKWGEWHCGENKELFAGRRRAEMPTLIEPFLRGESTRIHVLGDRAWEIRMGGESWLKSIHDPGARILPRSEIDPELVDDARRVGSHFGLEMYAIDYLVEPDGTKHLLELNHIPNVTLFPELREAYLDFVAAWVKRASVA